VRYSRGTNKILNNILNSFAKRLNPTNLGARESIMLKQMFKAALAEGVCVFDYDEIDGFSILPEIDIESDLIIINVEGEVLTQDFSKIGNALFINFGDGVITNNTINKINSYIKVNDLITYGRKDYILPQRFVTGLPNDARYFSDSNSISNDETNKMMRAGTNDSGSAPTFSQFPQFSTAQMREILRIAKEEVVIDTGMYAEDFGLMDFNNKESFKILMKSFMTEINAVMENVLGFTIEFEEVVELTASEINYLADAKIKNTQAEARIKQANEITSPTTAETVEIETDVGDTNEAD